MSSVCEAEFPLGWPRGYLDYPRPRLGRPGSDARRLCAAFVRTIAGRPATYYDGAAMSRPSPDEFLPLPYFPWLSRPTTVPLDVEEAATALFLDGGDVKAAASRLKVSATTLNRLVRRCPRLQRLRDDLAA
jgi:hypothetical protein